MSNEHSRAYLRYRYRLAPVPRVLGARRYGPPARTNGTGTAALRPLQCRYKVRTCTVWAVDGYCLALHGTFYGLAINFGRSLGDILGEMAPASRLGRQVNGVTYGYAQSWNIHRLHPDPPLLAPTSMTIHTIQGCESGRSQQAVGGAADPPIGWGNVPPSPLPCHCSLRGLQEGSAVSHTHPP